MALLVLELAEVDTGTPVDELVRGIDDVNVGALLNAIAMAAEWGTRGMESEGHG